MAAFEGLSVAFRPRGWPVHIGEHVDVALEARGEGVSAVQARLLHYRARPEGEGGGRWEVLRDWGAAPLPPVTAAHPGTLVMRVDLREAQGPSLSPVKSFTSPLFHVWSAVHPRSDILDLVLASAGTATARAEHAQVIAVAADLFTGLVRINAGSPPRFRLVKAESDRASFGETNIVIDEAGMIHADGLFARPVPRQAAKAMLDFDAQVYSLTGDTSGEALAATVVMWLLYATHEIVPAGRTAISGGPSHGEAEATELVQAVLTQLGLQARHVITAGSFQDAHCVEMTIPSGILVLDVCEGVLFQSSVTGMTERRDPVPRLLLPRVSGRGRDLQVWLQA